MSLLLISGQTDRGRRRTDNQDTFISKAIWSETSVLLSVIDGVGGYAGGDRAAAIAQESIEKYMASPNGDPLSMLREAVIFANNEIHAVRQKDLLLSQMGCVLTIALADCQAGKVAFVHVGDTRLYRYREGVLEKLTHDHSLVGAREDANELTEAEAMCHPRRNEILRDVGTNKHRVDDPDFLESNETDFLPGDTLLLCSDGLTDMITRAQIKAVLDKPISLDEQTTELIRLANDQGGKDNITVVLAKNNVAPEHFQNRLDQPDNVTSFSNKYSVENDTLPTQSKPVKKQIQTWLLIGISLLLIVGGIIWYQKRQFRQLSSLQHTTSDSAYVTLASDPPIPQLDSLIQVAHQDKDHRLVLAVDTFRLTKPLLMTDSLQSLISNSNRPTVLIPADTALVPVALRILRKGPVRLENIILRGFKTGIETTSDVKLHLENVLFQHVDLPVYVAIPPDTLQNSIIEISVRNQADTIKTIRR